MMQARNVDVLRFRAMGTEAHIVVTEPTPGADAVWARRRVDRLESLWSRFDPASEISRLNASGGMPMPVSSETITLLHRAATACELTQGRFNPFVGDALVGLGYDRSFEHISSTEGDAAMMGHEPATALSGAPPVQLSADPRTGVASFAALSRAAFDPGGIGKGLAADLVVEELLDAGVAGAMVNLGGDLRVTGDSPDGDGWLIEVHEPLAPAAPTLVRLHEGGLATSTTTRRRWRHHGCDRHHVVDPNTGESRHGDVTLTTAIAGAAWWAEAAATALTGGGVDDPVPERVSTRRVTADGSVRTDGALHWQIPEDASSR